MRIAVFSDVHGNPYALDAVLRSLERDGPFDHIVAAGDLAFGGSDPAGCVDHIRAAGILAVYGNTEVYLHSPHQKPGDQLHLKKWDRILADVWWNREVLGQDRLAWMAALPFDLHFSPTGDSEDDLLVFHANPLTIEEMLYPPPVDQVRLLGEVVQADDDPELGRLFEGVRAKTVAFGHYHFTSERRWKGFRMVNVAPVSMPAKDGDARARYSIFEWTGKEWNITRRHLEYDYTQEVDALSRTGMPCWRDHAATFPVS